MPDEQSLIIVGASVRAAAFSALRAGLSPWCADLFADSDLRALCPAIVIAAADYPQRFRTLVRTAPPGPWMYTGGIENHPRLAEQMAKERWLWGNARSVLERVRSPEWLVGLFRKAGIECPVISTDRSGLDAGKRWLVKPRLGAGGAGIHFLKNPFSQRRPRVFFQEFVEGPSYSAVYVGGPKGARMLGVTRQLVGEPWLHAAPFQYCGSIGPITVEPDSEDYLNRLGNVLSVGAGLRGLFGVDLIAGDGQWFPIEVNPRYTASIEVIEYASGTSLLALHRQVFDATAPALASSPSCNGLVAKMIEFARESIHFPDDGPWRHSISNAFRADLLPAFADIPAPGTLIERGQPVLSFFVAGSTLAEVELKMKRAAADVEHCLYASAK